MRTICALFSLVVVAPLYLPLSPSFAQPIDAALIYSPDPVDPWNRVFSHLFSRTISYRVTDAFPEGAPFFRMALIRSPDGISLSNRIFERFESGDRAIEPFYPSFMTNVGITEALSDSRLPKLLSALSDSINEARTRPPLHRALMQADLWAAHDELTRSTRQGLPTPPGFSDRAAPVLSLLGRLIRKIALAMGELGNLADNYEAAARHHRLPRLFAADSEWVEIEWTSFRIHDREADYRRAARVFVKPATRSRDRKAFLDRLLEKRGVDGDLDGVALVIQNLLIDREGVVLPARLTYGAQFRIFHRDAQGRIVKMDPEEYELSRALLLARPETGGLVRYGESAPAFLLTAGNDYGFATSLVFENGERVPVLGTLRSRCAACHGSDGARLVTFAMHAPLLPPSVKYLTQPNDIRATDVANRKANQDDFKRLQAHWSRSQSR